METRALYMRFREGITLQYVLFGQARQTLMALPLLSLVLTVWKPSAQKQLLTRVALTLEVQFMGHAFGTPVQHQKPGPHGWHGALCVPLYPAAQ